MPKPFKQKKPAFRGQSARTAQQFVNVHKGCESAIKKKPEPLIKSFKQKKAGSHLLFRFRSIIGAEVLDFRVRNGNGYCHLAMATGIHYYAFASRIRAFSRAPLSFMYSLLMEYKSLSSR